MICFCCIPLFAVAQEQGLDEALQGFDKEEQVTGAGGTLEDALEGFDEAAPERRPAKKPARKILSPWDLHGSLSLGASYNYRGHASLDPGRTDYHGLSRLRTELELGLDVKPSPLWDFSVTGRAFYDAVYALQARGEYTPEVLSRYEDEAEIKDAWIRGKLMPSLDMKLGRQIVVWGKSDNLRVTDVLNPLDNREPGQVDIEDLRLPLTMSRFDWYAGKWNLTAIAIHEIRFNKNPVYGSDFYPSGLPMPAEVIPDDGGRNTEYAVALNGILTGWDISLYGARLFDDRPHAVLLSPLPPQTELRHSRISMAGAALNIALGNWLLKSEAAHLDGLEFFSLPGGKKARTDALAGIEYTGITETTLSVEAVNRHLNDYDDRLASFPDNLRKNEVETALRVDRDFLNDRLRLTALAIGFGPAFQRGAFQRVSAKYDLTDTLSVTGGIVNYVSGTKTEFEHIGGNDRVFLTGKYSF